MPFIAILIGAVIVIAAFNDAHGTLAHELQQDIPGYFKWAAAIAAILGLGYIPAMRTPSRYLIALVAIVIVVTNYRQILAGFTQFAAGPAAPSGSGAAEPTSAYVQSSGTGGQPTQAQIAGIASPDAGAPSASSPSPTGLGNLASNFGNPSALLSSFTQSIGFGGMA